MKRQMQVVKAPKAMTPKVAGKGIKPEPRAAAHPAKSEAKTIQVDPKDLSTRKSTPKKTEPDSVPAGKRPNTLRSNKINAKKLDNIRI